MASSATCWWGTYIDFSALNAPGKDCFKVTSVINNGLGRCPETVVTQRPGPGWLQFLDSRLERRSLDRHRRA
jgi:hypothetical protein